MVEVLVYPPENHFAFPFVRPTIFPPKLTIATFLFTWASRCFFALVDFIRLNPFVPLFLPSQSAMFASRAGGGRSYHLDHKILHGHHVPPLIPDLVAAGQNPRRRTRNRLRPRETQRIAEGAAQYCIAAQQLMHRCKYMFVSGYIKHGLSILMISCLCFHLFHLSGNLWSPRPAARRVEHHRRGVGSEQEVRRRRHDAFGRCLYDLL